MSLEYISAAKSRGANMPIANHRDTFCFDIDRKPARQPSKRARSEFVNYDCDSSGKNGSRCSVLEQGIVDVPVEENGLAYTFTLRSGPAFVRNSTY